VERVRRLAGGRELPIVVYCASEESDASPRAAGRLTDAGFSAVYDYSGGLRAWKASGLDVESGLAEEDAG
jgi:rhodanese-related sulfurtransferase